MDATIILLPFQYIFSLLTLIWNIIVTGITLICNAIVSIIILIFDILGTFFITFLFPLIMIIVSDLLIPIIKYAFIAAFITFLVFVMILLILVYAGYITKPDLTTFDPYFKELCISFEKIMSNENRKFSLNESKRLKKLEQEKNMN